MKKKTMSLIVSGTIMSQLLIPNTMVFATIQNKNTVDKEATDNKNKVYKSNTVEVYTDAAMTQELKNLKYYIYPREVTLNFSGNATLDGQSITSGIKVTDAGSHILKVTNGYRIKTYNFSVINNINGKNIVSFSSAGRERAGAVDEDGNIYTWGENDSGQLGDGSRSNKNVPVKINGKGDIKENTKIVSISLGYKYTSAIDNEGNLYTWGENNYGQLGDGTRSTRYTPVKINGKGDISTSMKIVSVSLGQDYSSAIDSEGGLYTWGCNHHGQLGDGTNSDRYVPVKINGKGDIVGSSKIVSASLGDGHSGAIDSEGNLYTWGFNNSGQLGNGFTGDVYTPVKINGKGDIGSSSKVVSVSLGTDHSSAIDSEGNLYTWGVNNSGQLGNGTTLSRNTPVKINGKGDIGGSTKIVGVELFGRKSSAIDANGNLYLWGYNYHGYIGNGSSGNIYTPVKINGKGALTTSTKIVSLSLGIFSGTAIDANGNLYSWGCGGAGALGQGTYEYSDIPIETILSMDYDNIRSFEDRNNLLFDVKVQNANANIKVAYKLDNKSVYKYVNIGNVSDGVARISVPKSTSARNITFRLAVGNNIVNNLNNTITLPLNIGTEVTIPDPMLKKALNKAIDPNRAADATIYESEAKSLKSLSLSNVLTTEEGRKISNLEGIQHFTNLENLNIGNRSNQKGNISNISQLSELKKLNRLELQGNQISDITPLSNLVNLTYLDFAYNKISDITPLVNLVNLNVLYINENKISDISHLKKLVNLRDLDCSHNKISDITPLVNLVNLNTMVANNNQISDITPVNNLVNLTKLTINDQFVDASDVTTDKDTATVKNIVKNMNGELIAPKASNDYDYKDGNVIFKNINHPGKRIYGFEDIIKIGITMSNFSGNVTQDIIIQEDPEIQG